MAVPPIAAVNELRNARPRPVSLNRSAYQVVRTPTTMTPSTTPSGIAQCRNSLTPEKRAINEASATITRNTKMAFNVLSGLNSAPHHLVE